MLTKSETQKQAFDPAAEERIDLVVELRDNLVPEEIPARDGPQCPISPSDTLSPRAPRAQVTRDSASEYSNGHKNLQSEKWWQDQR